MGTLVWTVVFGLVLGLLNMSGLSNADKTGIIIAASLAGVNAVRASRRDAAIVALWARWKVWRATRHHQEQIENHRKTQDQLEGLPDRLAARLDRTTDACVRRREFLDGIAAYLKEGRERQLKAHEPNYVTQVIAWRRLVREFLAGYAAAAEQRFLPALGVDWSTGTPGGSPGSQEMSANANRWMENLQNILDHADTYVGAPAASLADPTGVPRIDVEIVSGPTTLPHEPGYSLRLHGLRIRNSGAPAEFQARAELKAPEGLLHDQRSRRLSFHHDDGRRARIITGAEDDVYFALTQWIPLYKDALVGKAFWFFDDVERRNTYVNLVPTMPAFVSNEFGRRDLIVDFEITILSDPPMQNPWVRRYRLGPGNEMRDVTL